MRTIKVAPAQIMQTRATFRCCGGSDQGDKKLLQTALGFLQEDLLASRRLSTPIVAMVVRRMMRMMMKIVMLLIILVVGTGKLESPQGKERHQQRHRTATHGKQRPAWAHVLQPMSATVDSNPNFEAQRRKLTCIVMLLGITTARPTSVHDFRALCSAPCCRRPCRSRGSPRFQQRGPATARLSRESSDSVLLQGGFKVRTSPKSGLQGLLEIAQAVL